MTQFKKKFRPFFGIVVFIFLICFVYLARWFYYRTMTIHQLLSENKQLKQAITNLTAEEQIGYAKVVTQEQRQGKVFTTIRFVETSRDDKLKKILEKEYTIEGDIVHFDALVVKFGDKMVMNGREKALYIWRRVYGERTAPEEGFPIEQPGVEPQRYNDLLKILPSKHRELFWSGIWDLANDPDKLRQHDIRAVYGNVVYSRLKPGLVYIFKISPAGQLYPEIVPDI
jgi:translation initiation factor 1 (eIF-1/SUI1)